MGGHPSSTVSTLVCVHAPDARRVDVHVDTGGRANVAFAATLDEDQRWRAKFDAAEGTVYWVQVDDGPPLLDPSCRDVVVTPDGPRSVVLSLIHISEPTRPY